MVAQALTLLQQRSVVAAVKQRTHESVNRSQSNKSIPLGGAPHAALCCVSLGMKYALTDKTKSFL